MLDSHQILSFRKPALRETRGDRHLLVWDELAQWVVADGELLRFLESFGERRTLGQVIAGHAQRTGRDSREVTQEAYAICSDLWGKAILYEGKSETPVFEEPIQIANITINVTNRCNLACPWCYNAGRARKPKYSRRAGRNLPCL